MSTMTMDMSSYAVDVEPTAGEVYGEEVLNAGWTPELALRPAGPSEHHESSRCVIMEDVGAFLNKMYASQR